MKPTLFMIALLSLVATASFGQQANNAPYLDPSLPPERRAADIVSRTTLEEKVLRCKAALLRFRASVYLPTIGGTRSSTVWPRDVPRHETDVRQIRRRRHSRFADDPGAYSVLIMPEKVAWRCH